YHVSSVSCPPVPSLTPDSRPLTHGSQPKPIHHHAILHHVRNPLANDARLVFPARLELLLVHDPHMFSNPTILVQNRSFNVTAAANPQRRLIGVPRAQILVLKIIRAHDHRIPDRHAFADHAP